MAQERATGNRGLFSRVATDALLDAHDRREPVLLYSGRRAYATSVSCAVCHTPSLCTTCGIPMRLHRTTEDFLVCYRCTAFVPVPSRCPACQTGTFRPAGLAGSQRVAESLATLLDRHGLTKVRAPVLDSDLVRTDDQEDDLLARLDAMTWPVLVATSMVFGHRYQRSFSLIVIPQTDALTVNPDFRTQERLIWQLEKLADFRPHTMILQAWHDGGILGLAKERRWDEALAEELVQRKALGWPPYTRLVKISFGHVDGAMARRAAATGAERLTRAVAHLKVGGKVAMFGPTPALAGHGAGRWVEHVILKTTLGSEVLSHLLAHVPSGAVVDIDPRSIT
jgi:primosomal protein N' (replication factor Y)